MVCGSQFIVLSSAASLLLLITVIMVIIITAITTSFDQMRLVMRLELPLTFPYSWLCGYGYHQFFYTVSHTVMVTINSSIWSVTRFLVIGQLYFFKAVIMVMVWSSQLCLQALIFYNYTHNSLLQSVPFSISFIMEIQDTSFLYSVLNK